MARGTGFFRRGAAVGVLASVAAIGVGVSTALAANKLRTKTVTVGQLFTPTADCTIPGTALQTGVAGGKSYTVPKTGVITSWSFDDGATAVAGLELTVGRSAGAGRYKTVSDALAGTQNTNQVNTYRTHIRVKAGDVIGIYEAGAGYCDGFPSSSDTYGWANHRDVDKGTTAPFEALTGDRFPVSVRVKVTR